MLWRLFHFNGPDPAEACRRVHEVWLTRAMASRRHYPRIPLRRVDRGGFDRLVARPRGRELAESWWATALERLDDQGLP